MQNENVDNSVMEELSASNSFSELSSSDEEDHELSSDEDYIER